MDRVDWKCWGVTEMVWAALEEEEQADSELTRAGRQTTGEQPPSRERPWTDVDKHSGPGSRRDPLLRVSAS